MHSAAVELPPAAELVFDLADLAARLRRVGALIVWRARASTRELTTLFGAGARALVRWEEGARTVTVTQPVPAGAVDAVLVARINALLPVPALALDVDSGALAYRTRLFSDAGGGLDCALFDETIAALLRDVSRTLAMLDGSGDDAGDARAADQPFLGYAE